MNHDKYLQLSWKEKNERIGKLVHLYQNSETMFHEMNLLIIAAEKANFFNDVVILPPNNPPADPLSNPQK